MFKFDGNKKEAVVYYWNGCFCIQYSDSIDISPF